MCDSSFNDEEALFKHLREDDHGGIDAEEEGGVDDVGSRESPVTTGTDPFEATDEYISNEEEI